MFLALDYTISNQGEYATQKASHASIIEVFAPVGREMVKRCPPGECRLDVIGRGLFAKSPMNRAA